MKKSILRLLDRLLHAMAGKYHLFSSVGAPPPSETFSDVWGTWKSGRLRIKDRLRDRGYKAFRKGK